MESGMPLRLKENSVKEPNYFRICGSYAQKQSRILLNIPGFNGMIEIRVKTTP